MRGSETGSANGSIADIGCSRWTGWTAGNASITPAAAMTGSIDPVSSSDAAVAAGAGRAVPADGSVEPLGKASDDVVSTGPVAGIVPGGKSGAEAASGGAAAPLSSSLSPKQRDIADTVRERRPCQRREQRQSSGSGQELAETHRRARNSIGAAADARSFPKGKEAWLMLCCLSPRGSPRRRKLVGNSEALEAAWLSRSRNGRRHEKRRETGRKAPPLRRSGRSRPSAPGLQRSAPRSPAVWRNRSLAPSRSSRRRRDRTLRAGRRAAASSSAASARAAISAARSPRPSPRPARRPSSSIPPKPSHGDLGMVTRDDVILALSWSGETAELRSIVEYSRRFGNPADRDDRDRRQLARPPGRRRPAPAAGGGGLPARPRADHLDADAARARRCARRSRSSKAAASPPEDFHALPSRRPARRQASISSATSCIAATRCRSSRSARR